jgi:hypothetical protein
MDEVEKTSSRSTGNPEMTSILLDQLPILAGCADDVPLLSHFFASFFGCSFFRPWDGLQLSHARYAPGFKSRCAQSHLLSFRTSSRAGCVLGFWWFALYELHVISSMWSEAEALSEYGVVPE